MNTWMLSPHWKTSMSFVGLVLVITLWMTPVLAQEAEVIAAGKEEFRRHCVICHGLSGTGEGVMGTLNLLNEKPTDLTQLRKQNKGTFPFWQTYRIIDGRELVKGHGTPDMPIWGDVFQAREGSVLTTETQAIGRILAIVYYLQSIQAKE